MQKILITLLLSCLNWATYAQLGWTQQEVKEEYGAPQYADYTDNAKNWYIGYDTEVYSEASGNYTQVKVCYFLKNSEKASCVYWCLFAPRAEINESIKLFDRKFVKIDTLKWKDYARGVIYRIELDDEFCIVKCHYDLD